MGRTPRFMLLLVTTLLLGISQLGWGCNPTRSSPMGELQLVDTNAPLPEYPGPQMVRRLAEPEWLWQFQAGPTNDPPPTIKSLVGGNSWSLPDGIPSPASPSIMPIRGGTPHLHPPAWSGKRIPLHLMPWIGNQVFVNGRASVSTRAVYDAVTYDITLQLIGSGPQEFLVRVYDPTDAAGLLRGKQTSSGGIAALHAAASGSRCGSNRCQPPPTSPTSGPQH